MDLKRFWVKFSRKKNFGPEKNFGHFSQRKYAKNYQNRQKWHFWGLRGELTCVLQVKIRLFYSKMVNSVMTLHFWAPKMIFLCDFRPISNQKLVKMVNFGELWHKFGHLKPIKAVEFTWLSIFMDYVMGNDRQGTFEGL